MWIERMKWTSKTWMNFGMVAELAKEPENLTTRALLNKKQLLW